MLDLWYRNMEGQFVDSGLYCVQSWLICFLRDELLENKIIEPELVGKCTVGERRSVGIKSLRWKTT
jgi:hypothetical protein